MRKEVQAQVREFREVLKADHCLLVPESYIMQNWDKVTMSALFFTAIVTPFEVSFLETEAGSFLFWINQVSVRVRPPVEPAAGLCRGVPRAGGEQRCRDCGHCRADGPFETTRPRRVRGRSCRVSIKSASATRKSWIC